MMREQRSNKIIRRIKNNIYRKLRIHINYHKKPVAKEWFFKHAKRLNRFHNIHSKKSCFIIGNGISLRNMDLSPLRDYYTFGLNKIHLIFDKVDLSLNYHVAVNKLVIEQSIDNFKAMNCPSFLSYNVIRNMQYCSDEKFYYLLTDGPYTFNKDITSPIHEGYTVTFVALQIAYFMGFHNVYLIGVDHKFNFKGKPNEIKYMAGNDDNHFDQNYFKNKAWQLPDLESAELSYHMARYYYNKANRFIYDDTVDGKLDIFQ